MLLARQLRPLPFRSRPLAWVHRLQREAMTHSLPPSITKAIPNPSPYIADPPHQKWSDDDPGHDVQGAGHGRHTKRTLASLSMDGKVCVVTGAGRGLGNMMARTFVES